MREVLLHLIFIISIVSCTNKEEIVPTPQLKQLVIYNTFEEIISTYNFEYSGNKLSKIKKIDIINDDSVTIEYLNNKPTNKKDIWWPENKFEFTNTDTTCLYMYYYLGSLITSYSHYFENSKLIYEINFMGEYISTRSFYWENNNIKKLDFNYGSDIDLYYDNNINPLGGYFLTPGIVGLHWYFMSRNNLIEYQILDKVIKIEYTYNELNLPVMSTKTDISADTTISKYYYYY